MVVGTSPKLSEVLPPLIFGTATFNYQFNVDPYALNPNTLVERALAQGVRAFDTSPYYGPAEEILGTALRTEVVKANYSRDQYFILTKVGRISSDTFDYSAKWVRHSVDRSCKRLGTNYLDVVYCHDVEFVSPAEVLEAIRELRRIRDQEGKLKYVGICGYPIDTLCDLAEFILRETGEPLDVVQSYANFTLQNTRLLTKGLARFVAAGVDVVPNASPLGMGLLRRQGPPVGAMGNWHPAPDELRQACSAAADWTGKQDEKLEIIAVRFALENWLREGSKVGTYGDPLPATGQTFNTTTSISAQKLGVSVMGVSKIEELDETMRVWRSVLDGLADDLDAEPGTLTPSDAITDHEWSLQRRQKIRVMSRQIREIIGSWTEFAWASPDPGFVNKRKAFGLIEDEEAQPTTATRIEATGAGPMLTPPSDVGTADPMASISASSTGQPVS